MQKGGGGGPSEEDTLLSIGGLSLTVFQWVFFGDPLLSVTHSYNPFPHNGLLEANSPHPTFKLPL